MINWIEELEVAAESYDYKAPRTYDAPKVGFLKGAQFGRELERKRILEMLRSSEAYEKFTAEKDDLSNGYTMPDEWANWIEERLK